MSSQQVHTNTQAKKANFITLFISNSLDANILDENSKLGCFSEAD